MSEGAHFYPGGSPLVSWGESERSAWLAHVGPPRRSYADDVIAKLEPLKDAFDVVQYGALSQDPGRYPLFCVKTRNWDASKPCALITGGVHGYETRYDGVLCCFCSLCFCNNLTSGVHGALLFLQKQALVYSEVFASLPVVVYFS